MHSQSRCRLRPLLRTGALTETELQDGLRAQHKTDREIKQMWERLDLNKDGLISKREYALMSIAV